MARTPAAWRVVAAGVLGGGWAVGFAATRSPAAQAIVLGAVGAGLGAVVPIARASRHPPIAPREAGGFAETAHGPVFTIVVAGRDEATVLPRLVRDVAAQDHRAPDGRPLLELVVIDDRSVDDSVEAVTAAAADAGIAHLTTIVRRAGPNLADGKGAALTALPPERYRGEFAVVLDADARIGSSFLRTLAHYVASGADAITARRRILDAGSGWLAGAQADEQTIDGELQRGRWALGGLSEFRGNGIVVRRDLLVEVGGWRADALTEDLDLSSRVAAARGHGVAWALDAEVWEEPVRGARALWRQRTRWAEGAVRRALQHGPAVLLSRRPSLRAKLDFTAYVGQLLVPPIFTGVLSGAVVRRRPRTALLVAAGYGTTAGAVAWDALRWETDPRGRPLASGERGRRALRAIVFGGVWLAAVPAAWWRLATRRGTVPYDKMTHHGAPAPWTPPPAPPAGVR